jgi:LPS-assembly protein
LEFFKLRHKNLIFFIIVVFLKLIFSFNSVAEAREKTVELNADKIIYDDLSGTATAEGNAVLSYGDVMIFAERIDYDDETGKVIASSLPDVGVTLRNNNQALRGDRLLYDINTTEGVMYGARSTVVINGKPVFIYGDNLEAIPYEIAVERKLISDKGSFAGDYVIKWDNVSLTTCVLDHPHYRLEAKRFIFTPLHRVVVKRPRLYLGDKYVFTYPFDYIINVKRDRTIKAAIFPHVSYQSSKGVGVGFSGPITWDSGGLSLGALYWSDIGFEWNVALEQRIGKDFSFFGELEYTWDRMWEEKKYRPDLSLRFEQPSWFAQLSWRRNQYLEMQKHSEYQYRGELDTEPEFLVGTPWLREGAGWYRVSAMWGNYQATTINDNGIEETDPWTGRFKVTAEGYVESQARSVTPFLNLNASVMFYNDDDDMRQDVINAIFGLRYNFGGLKLGTAYARKWVSGESPMNWDAEFDNERIYQKLEIPFGKYLSLNVLGGYDLKASFLEEMNYTLRYLNDCMLWELTYRNDRNTGGENKIFFSIGFVGTSLEIKNDRIYDPFDSPVPKN